MNVLSILKLCVATVVKKEIKLLRFAFIVFVFTVNIASNFTKVWK